MCRQLSSVSLIEVSTLITTCVIENQRLSRLLLLLADGCVQGPLLDGSFLRLYLHVGKTTAARCTSCLIALPLSAYWRSPTALRIPAVRLAFDKFCCPCNTYYNNLSSRVIDNYYGIESDGHIMF